MVVVVGKENQGIRMSYILMIMHERVAGIMKVGQIDSYTFAIARFCVYLLLNRGHDIAPNCNIFVWLISLPPVASYCRLPMYFESDILRIPAHHLGRREGGGVEKQTW